MGVFASLQPIFSTCSEILKQQTQTTKPTRSEELHILPFHAHILLQRHGVGQVGTFKILIYLLWKTFLTFYNILQPFVNNLALERLANGSLKRCKKCKQYVYIYLNSSVVAAFSLSTEKSLDLNVSTPYKDVAITMFQFYLPFCITLLSIRHLSFTISFIYF